MKHCLFIDNSPIVLKVASAIFRDVGFRVVEMSDPVQAIDHCRIEMPELIFLDGRLPRDGAMTFLESFQLIKWILKPQIVYLSLEQNPPEWAAAKAGGADELMMKPFDRKSIRETLYRKKLAA